MTVLLVIKALFSYTLHEGRAFFMGKFRIEDLMIYEDTEIVVCHKPAGFAVQNARFGTMDMESALKNYYALKNPGKEPYIGIVHRLDQPVEGVLVFAKNPAAAKELSRQMAAGEMGKEYLAVTSRKIEPSAGRLEDFLKKDGRTNTSSVVGAKTPGAKKALLSYEFLQETEDETTESGKRYLVKICLETGRHHQIRVQTAHAGMPLLGDRKYNSAEQTKLPLGLCSCRLQFRHPKTKKEMEFHVFPKGETFAGFEKNPKVPE